ncbi:ATP-dependent helicase, partial [candidate division WWE3 bacterium]|nr:ATP-dependent helicase [candidate division WWE3 bacterium]
VWVERGEDEAELVVDKIEELVTKQGYDFRDVAILVRANNHAEIFTRALSRRGVPFQFLGPGQLYNQPEIKDLLAYFRILTDLTDNQAMYRLLVKPYFGIDRRDVAALVTWADQENIHLFRALEQLPEDDAPLDISTESIRKMKKMLAILQRHIERLPDYPPGQLLYFFLEDTDMLKLYQTVDSEKRQKEVLNISRFFEEIRSFETRQKDATVYEWLEYVEFVWQQGESPLASELDWLEVNAVNLLSVHSAKGLEFPIVFLVNLVNARFPTHNRRDQIPIPDALAKESLPEGDVHEQEERRLFYVGMTRAKDYLYLTGAKFYGDNKRPKKLSGFIHEALGEDLTPYLLESTQNTHQLELFEQYATQEEKEEPVQPLSRKVDYLTYSRINSFQICPMHYYMQYVLNVPMPPSASASFGSTIHNTLKHFYQWAVIESKNETLDDTQKLKSKVSDIYKQNWIARGFESKQQEE